MYFSNAIDKKLTTRSETDVILMGVTADSTTLCKYNKLRIFEDNNEESYSHLTYYKMSPDIITYGGVKYKNYYLTCGDKAYFSLTYGSLCTGSYDDDIYFSSLKRNNYRLVIQKLFGMQVVGHGPNENTIEKIFNNYEIDSYDIINTMATYLTKFDKILVWNLNTNEFGGIFDKVRGFTYDYTNALYLKKVAINNNIINFGLLLKEESGNPPATYYLPYIYDRNNQLIILGVNDYVDSTQKSIQSQVGYIVNQLITTFPAVIDGVTVNIFVLAVMLRRYTYKQIYNVNIDKYMYSDNTKHNIFLFDNYSKRNNSYISRINLHDKYNNVLAVAKLSRPINCKANLCINVDV